MQPLQLLLPLLLLVALASAYINLPFDYQVGNTKCITDPNFFRGDSSRCMAWCMTYPTFDFIFCGEDTAAEGCTLGDYKNPDQKFPFCCERVQICPEKEENIQN